MLKQLPCLLLLPHPEKTHRFRKWTAPKSVFKKAIAKSSCSPKSWKITIFWGNMPDHPSGSSKHSQFTNLTPFEKKRVVDSKPEEFLESFSLK